MMFEDREAYAIAERKAMSALSRAEPQRVALEKQVSFDSDSRVFRVPFLGKEHVVSHPQGVVAGPDEQRLCGAVAVIILHYLVYRGEPLRSTGWRAYRDMPGARDFSRTFESMAERRLAVHFEEDLAALQRAASLMGGTPVEMGDASFEIPALPRVPIAVVLWAASNEFDGSARILFKPSAPYYLHTEDLAALGVVVAERLMDQSACSSANVTSRG